MTAIFLLLSLCGTGYFLSVGMYGAAVGAAIVALMIILFLVGAL